MTRLAVLFAAVCVHAHAACDETIAEIDIGARSVAFAVEIADTPASRARGLMFRDDLPRDAGMLFVFEDAAPRAFWMENTPLSLDMLFFDARGVLCGVVEEAEPFSRTPRESGCDAQFVLEIHGGLSARLGIAPGAALRHPAVGPDAASACTTQ